MSEKTEKQTSMSQSQKKTWNMLMNHLTFSDYVWNSVLAWHYSYSLCNMHNVYCVHYVNLLYVWNTQMKFATDLTLK